MSKAKLFNGDTPVRSSVRNKSCRVIIASWRVSAWIYSAAIFRDWSVNRVRPPGRILRKRITRKDKKTRGVGGRAHGCDTPHIYDAGAPNEPHTIPVQAGTTSDEVTLDLGAGSTTRRGTFEPPQHSHRSTLGPFDDDHRCRKQRKTE